MKAVHYIALIGGASLLLGGCKAEEEVKPLNDDAQAANPAQGPGGGESADQTAPAGTAASAQGIYTSSAFPKTVQPTGQPPAGE